MHDPHKNRHTTADISGDSGSCPGLDSPFPALSLAMPITDIVSLTEPQVKEAALPGLSWLKRVHPSVANPARRASVSTAAHRGSAFLSSGRRPRSYWLAGLLVLELLVTTLLWPALFPMSANAADGSGSGGQNGTSSVSQYYGAYNTEVPLSIPDFHGLQPELKLSYSSSSQSNGLAGVGWNLSGAPSEVRRLSPGGGTPKFDATDIYALDGNELVPNCITFGGTYCTKLQTYVRIQYDSAANNWYVWGTNGVKSTYAPTLNLGAGVFGWSLQTMSDTNGNTVTYTYTNDTTNVYLNTIEYNSVKVSFFYEARPDTQSAAVGGTTLVMYSKRLKSVDVGVNVSGSLTQLRAYELSYRLSADSGRSLLSNVQQYGRDVQINLTSGDITGGSVLPALGLNYQDRASAFDTVNNPTTDVSDNLVFDSNTISTQGDFNADGKTDLAFTRPGWTNWRILLANGSGGFTTAYWTTGANGLASDTYNYVYSGDFNGDGKSDIAYTRPGWTSWTVLLSTGSGFTVASWNTGANGLGSDAYNYIYTGDFNGDGKTDIAYTRPGWTSWNVRLSTGTGFTVANWTTGASGLGSDAYNYIYAGDFNGDGKTDLAYTRPGWASWTVLVSTGSGFQSASWATGANGLGSDAYNYIYTGDFNGDGKTDIVYTRPGATSWNVRLSTGSGFQSASWATDANGLVSDNNNYIYAGDFNGDGKTDIAYIRPGWTKWYVRLSNGSGFTATGGWVINAGAVLNSSNRYRLFGGDFKGNGTTSLGFLRQTYKQVQVPVQTINQVSVSGGISQNNHDTDYLRVSGSTITFLDYQNSVKGTLTFQNVSLTPTYTSPTCGFSDPNDQGAGVLLTGVSIRSDHFDFKYTKVNTVSTAVTCSVYLNGATLTSTKPDLSGFGLTLTVTGSNQLAVALGLGDSGTVTLSGSLITTYQTQTQVDKAQVVTFLNTGLGNASDLLSSVTNGVGGTTTLQYAPSSQWANTYLPVGAVFQTVSALTTDDGRGNSATTNYSYANGLWSNAEHRFLGFGKVTSILNGQGSTTETYYLQSVGSMSKPLYTYFKDNQGKIYNYSAYTYAENTTAPYTSLLTDKWDYECNQASACRRNLVQFTYDQYANVTQTKEYGDYDLTGDANERIIVRGYYPTNNSSTYIVGMPAYQNTYKTLADPTATNLLAATRYYYDNATANTTQPTKGLITKTEVWNNQDNTYPATTKSYDQWGNLLSQTDPNGNTETTTYDPTYHFYATKKCNALIQCSTQTWDYTLGLPTSLVGINGNKVSYSYDVFGRKTDEYRYTDTAGTTVDQHHTTQYLNWGSPTSQKVRVTATETGLWTDTYQDGLGRVYRQVQGSNGTTLTITTDTLYSGASSRVFKKSLPYYTGSTSETPVYTVYSYDGAMRQTVTTNPDGTKAQVVYANDANGKPYETYLDEMGHEKVIWRDGRGNVLQVREKNAGNYYYTTYQYDALDRLTQLSDNSANLTTVSYNSLGDKLSQQDPDLGTWTYNYDGAGLLKSQTDAKGQTINFTYDKLGRLTTKTYPDGSKLVNTYDQTDAAHGAGLGKLTSVSYPKSAGSESYTYSLVGQVTSQTRCVDTVCKTVKNQYDAGDRLVGLTYPDGENVTYSYDGLGRPSTLSGYVTSASYNARGQLTSLVYANGTTNTYTYDPNRAWLNTVQVTNSAATSLYQTAYTYNAAGLVATQNSTTNSLSNNLTYTYDDLNRLVGVSGGQTQSWSYDALGRQTTNSAKGTYSYTDPKHIHAATQVDSFSVTYDANGNVVATSDGSKYVWNYDNMLASATIPVGVSTTQTISFGYDGGEGRIKKTTGSGSSQVVTRYFSPLVEEQTTGTNSPVLTKYYQFGGLTVAEQVGGSSSGSGKHWYHSDRLGSVVLLTNSTGAISKSYDYKAYGEIAGSSGTATNVRTYTGQRLDSETGLIYLGARYYSAGVGTFLSADTIVPDLYNPQSLNHYSYAYNNPVNNTDPTGHIPVVAAVIGAIVTVAAAVSTIVTVAAVVGAAVTIAGYFTHDPVLSTIGSILTGFAGDGGVVGLGTAVAAATSPLSPLGSTVKEAIGWAYTAYGLIQSFTTRGSSSNGESSAGTNSRSGNELALGSGYEFSGPRLEPFSCGPTNCGLSYEFDDFLTSLQTANAVDQIIASKGVLYAQLPPGTGAAAIGSGVGAAGASFIPAPNCGDDKFCSGSAAFGGGVFGTVGGAAAGTLCTPGGPGAVAACSGAAGSILYVPGTYAGAGAAKGIETYINRVGQSGKNGYRGADRDLLNNHPQNYDNPAAELYRGSAKNACAVGAALTLGVFICR